MARRPSRILMLWVANRHAASRVSAYVGPPGPPNEHRYRRSRVEQLEQPRAELLAAPPGRRWCTVMAGAACIKSLKASIALAAGSSDISPLTVCAAAQLVDPVRRSPPLRLPTGQVARAADSTLVTGDLVSSAVPDKVGRRLKCLCVEGRL